MQDLIDKLSAYNFFNYLLPGAVFSILATQYTSADLLTKDLLVAFFSFYFIGLVISRVGSLIIEPLLIKIRFVIYADYSLYLKASTQDQEIKNLMEVGNTYRSLIALFLSLGVFKGYDLLLMKYPNLNSFSPYMFGTTFLVLFLYAFRKQSNYINKRISDLN